MISEKNPNGDTITFNPDKRVKLDLSGYMERNYLKRPEVYINMVEYGDRTKSTITFSLKLQNNNYLCGTFSSTANGSGTATFERL